MVRCVPVVSQHRYVLCLDVCQWSVSMGLCYGQLCANGQSAWVCAMVRCVPVVSQHGFVLWSGVWVCASGQSAWVCAMVRCVPVVSQHGFVRWSGVCQWSVSMGLCYGQVCASGQSAWVCAMVRCVPVVSQHGFVLWSGVCQWSVSMGLCYDWCMSMVNLCLQFCYKEEVRTVVHCCADNCSTPVVSNCAQIFVCFSHLQHSGILQCIQYTDMVIFGVLVGGVTINDTTCLQSTLTTY